MKTIYISILLCLVFTNCESQDNNPSNGKNQDEIIEKYLKNGAWNHHYLTKEWDEWINKGIKEDSTIAYLWQQKAIPFWKTKKYKIAIQCYDKAVELDPQKWLARLAFLKCIFTKDYEGALSDFKNYKNAYGSTFEQDHPIELYMGICYLQLNQFDEAMKALKENVESQEERYGVDWVHYLDRYYLAMAYYEHDDYQKAIDELNKVLKEYPNFSDAQYYKSICLNYLGEKDAVKNLIATGLSNFEQGHSFNEDSNQYEDYPYQITWQWKHVQSIIK